MSAKVTAPGESGIDEGGKMARKKFDASIPRRMYWSNEIKNKKRCPECNSKLEEEYHTYLLIIKGGNEFESFITGHDGGYFCPKCPVIILDYKTFSEIASATDIISSSFEFTVAGIVDIDAIPPDKSHLPLGDDDNPIPLVKFIQRADKDNSERKDRGKRRRSKKHRKRE